MADLQDLFRNGEPPDPDDLRDFLISEYKITPDRADKIVADYEDYNSPGLTGAPDVNWTPESLRGWVENEIPNRPNVTQDLTASQGGAFGDAAARFAGDVDPLSRANEAAEEAMSRGQRVRDRFYRAADMFFDSGPAMDPDSLAQSLAIGVFTDAAGNPQIDPNTGAPREVTPATLWEAIKGQTFDMGTLSMPRARGRREGGGQPRAGREGADDARLNRLETINRERRRFVTPSMAMALLGSMPADYLTRLQQQMWEAGLFGDQPPSWGVADEATRQAYMAVFAEASLTPDDTIDRVLARLTDEAVTRGANGAGAGAEDEIPAFKPEVASEESLSKMIDDITGDLMGRFATDEEKTALIAKLREGEIGTQKAQYDRDVSTMAGGPGDLDRFMAAISAQESGGNYNARNAGSGAYGKFQIMPANWGPWAERAGLGRNAPRTPENQETVARKIMGDYYRQFGNWRDVAIAWFAGPGAVGAPGAENRSDGNMSVREYADLAVQRMADLGAQAGSSGGYAAGQARPIETWDPAAEAEAAIKASDPIGWEGHQFAQRAVDFYSLLGGLG